MLRYMSNDTYRSFTAYAQQSTSHITSHEEYVMPTSNSRAS